MQKLVMQKLVKRLAVATLVGMPIIGGVVVPAGPSGAATAVHAVLSTKAGPDVTPNSTIKGKGKKSKYKPTALTAAEDTSGNDCSTGFVSFTVTNPGKTTQYITADDSGTYEPFGALGPKSQGAVCLYNGTAGDTFTLGLSNSTGSVNYKSHLTVTVSD